MRWLANLKTRSKLTAAFGIVILLLLVLLFTARSSIIAIRDGERSIADILAVRNNFNGQRAALLATLLLPPGEDPEPKLREVAAYSSDNDEIMKRIEAKHGLDPELQADVRQFVAIRDEYLQVRDNEVIPLVRQRKKDEASALILGAQSVRFEKFRMVARDYSLRLTERSEARMDQAELAFGILGALGILTGFGMIVILGRHIAEPLEKMTAAANRIADGDLDVDIACSERGDEVGALTKTFQRMIISLTVLSGRARQIAEGDLTAQIKPRSERDVLGNAFANMNTSLRRVMQELVDAVNTLASTGSQIMASTSQLAASATETATAVSETTATVEEVKQTSQISSQKARKVADESQRAAEVAKTGKRAVDQTIEGMNGIRQQMGRVAESILTLSAQGQAIGEIISTVDDLAAQSKLLAVNASIEAAKAGEEGRGFSVVAQEVKSLAEQSKQATLQVRAILKDIQKATGSAVLATEQGSKVVETGVQQSGAAGESIGTLAENVAAAAHAATHIAATCQQQFAGMDQVAVAMENIKQASTQTVTSTKQTESAAQQLNALGQKLKTMLGGFKL